MPRRARSNRLRRRACSKPLFGGFQRRAPEPLPPQTSSYADPLACSAISGRPEKPSGFGHGTVYCVRTCDGRYFPLQRHAGASPAELCKSFCPAAKTMVFSGSKIDTAVAQNGTRYADLDNAFAYRDKVSDGCSCNGKDELGLARVDASGDPTLRPGDIVATNDGLAAYNGKSRNRRIHTAQYLVERMGPSTVRGERSSRRRQAEKDRASGE